MAYQTSTPVLTAEERSKALIRELEAIGFVSLH